MSFDVCPSICLLADYFKVFTSKGKEVTESAKASKLSPRIKKQRCPLLYIF